MRLIAYKASMSSCRLTWITVSRTMPLSVTMTSRAESPGMGTSCSVAMRMAGCPGRTATAVRWVRLLTA